MSSVLLGKLRKEELELLADAKKLNDRRRRIYKSWFKRNLWLRFTTHTDGMNPVPWLSDWLYTKKLDDTYRGSIKDATTSNRKEEHGYGDVVRLSWSNNVVKTGLEIVLDSRDLLAPFVEGRTINIGMLVDWIAQTITDAVNELIEQHQPDCPTRLEAAVRMPERLLTNIPLNQLQQLDLTISFALVNRVSV